MKKVYLLPNMITAFGLSCGLFIIFKSSMTGPGEGTFESVQASAVILILAALADLLDGALARAMSAESEFGGNFDSLSDAVTFGVAPSVLILKSLSVEPGTSLSFFVTAAAMLFSMCGILRLVRFNTQSLSKDPSNQEIDITKNFTGLPIPGAAGALVSGHLLLLSPELQALCSLDDRKISFVMIGMMLFLGYLMLSRWKFPSLKTLQLRVPSFNLVFLTVLFAVFLFYGIVYYFPVVFAGLSWAYIFVACTLSAIRQIAGRKSKTLVDFEPAPEDWEN